MSVNIATSNPSINFIKENASNKDKKIKKGFLDQYNKLRNRATLPDFEYKVEKTALSTIQTNADSDKLTKGKISRNISILGNTMFCRNGSALSIISEVSNVCLINFTVSGPVIFIGKENEQFEKRIALHSGSYIEDLENTNANKIYNLNVAH